MIDFENYKRVTIRHEDGSHSFMYDYNAITPPIKTLLDRLAELEDLIEKKKLIPNCLIIKGDSGEWYVLHFNDGFFNAYQCRTRQEAEMKKEELMEIEQ